MASPTDTEENVVWSLGQLYDSPTAGSDAWHGAVKSRWWFPFEVCPECQMNKGTGFNLPIECPDTVKSEIKAVGGGRGVSRLQSGDFQELVRSCQPEVAKTGWPEALTSGDRFAPRVWTVPLAPRQWIYRPNGSFGWFFSSRIVSQIKEELLAGVILMQVDRILYSSDDFETASAMLAKNVDKPEKICDTEFSEDHFFEAKVRVATEAAADEPGVRLIPCQTCGYVKSRNTDEYMEYFQRLTDNNQIPRQHVPGIPVFWSHVTRSLAFKDEVFQKLPRGLRAHCDVQRWDVV